MEEQWRSAADNATCRLDLPHAPRHAQLLQRTCFSFTKNGSERASETSRPPTRRRRLRRNHARTALAADKVVGSLLLLLQVIEALVEFLDFCLHRRRSRVRLFQLREDRGRQSLNPFFGGREDI